MIVQPEQYEINKMEQGDIIYVIKRPLWYRLFRKYLLSNKEQVSVKQNFNSDKYNLYYKEDCILIYQYELICTETYNNIDYFITKSNSTVPLKRNLKSITVNLYNLQLILEDNTSITIPLDKIKQGIKSTEQMLKNVNRQELIDTQIKFMRYKGDYFKQLIIKNNIKKLNVMYCSLCGKSLVFKFKRNSIDVINNCKCNNLAIDYKSMNYDEFAVWYASQTDGKFRDIINQQLFTQKES